MPRRREVPKREILPDPKFGNVDLSKFMNVIMEGGKKAVAERIIYGALEQIEIGRRKGAAQIDQPGLGHTVTNGAAKLTHRRYTSHEPVCPQNRFVDLPHPRT